MILKMYEKFLGFYGPQGWWPVNHGFSPPDWEIMVGAVLTQNTSWNNVEKALSNMEKADIKDRDSLLALGEDELAKLIRPAGYYNQKARKLTNLAKFSGFRTRDTLLSQWGIGKETADSILLYAKDKAYFVVDAYTRRIFSRLGLIDEKAGYEEIRQFFEDRLPRDPRIYKEFHAMIVRLAKENCTKNKPKCSDCHMNEFCKYEK